MDDNDDGEIDVSEFVSALQGSFEVGAYYGELEKRQVEGLIKHSVGLVKNWPLQSIEEGNKVGLGLRFSTLYLISYRFSRLVMSSSIDLSL